MKKIYPILFALTVLLSCQTEEEKQKNALVKAYTQVGDRITKQSFASLSGRLKAAMKQGGPIYAIQFCNMQALPLTDSLSKAFQVKIKRTSLRLRNEQNTPDSLELYMLGLYEQIEKMRKPLVSKAMITHDQRLRYFAPIQLKPQCLQCHGTVGREVADSVYAVIKEKYPNDKATGFQVGQLRGMWSLDFGPADKLTMPDLPAEEGD